MKQSYNSWIVVVFLVLIFLFGIYINFDNSYIGFCDGEAECVFDLVVETNNFELCKFSIDDSNCYTDSSILFDDISLCELNLNSSFCYMNFAHFKKDIFACSFVTKDLVDKCIFDVAISLEDFKICNNSLDSGLCYYSYALHFKDVNVCDLSEKYKSKCTVSLLEGQNESN
ncbi:MAG: hypothetical protein PF569_09075 [Candidatus Woesearchaeota archaeon]|nr:hypothetical protein [Candidatus Woesearchaeota archaeon]